jgi:hypothetical protein
MDRLLPAVLKSLAEVAVRPAYLVQAVPAAVAQK